MYCIDLRSKDPSFNLALEEILVINKKDDFLILGINDSSVIIGKHQVAHREINTKFILENNIPVIRRISGGGTVFHDNGNLNFTFIMQSEHGKQINFRKYTLPVINFLSTIGIDAKFEGKNDLKVGDFKISGNAEHLFRERILHHGTLLFESELDNLRNSLRKEMGNYTTRAVKSNPSPVINLKSLLEGSDSITQFKSLMMDWFLKNFPGAELYEPDEKDLKLAETLAETKYRTWEWNYSYGPEYNFNNSFQINEKHHTCSLFVKDGIIRKGSIEGSDQMMSVAKKLIGCRHVVPEVLKVFREENISLSDEEIYCFF